MAIEFIDLCVQLDERLYLAWLQLTPVTHTVLIFTKQLLCSAINSCSLEAYNMPRKETPLWGSFRLVKSRMELAKKVLKRGQTTVFAKNLAKFSSEGMPSAAPLQKFLLTFVFDLLRNHPTRATTSPTSPVYLLGYGPGKQIFSFQFQSKQLVEQMLKRLNKFLRLYI